MTNYTTQVDKNGKTLYYRITDGKKKNVSRVEYEANQTVEDETVEMDTVLTVKDAAVEYINPEQIFIEAESTVEVAETVEEANAAETAVEIVAVTEISREQGEVETAAFDFVKDVIEATGSKYANKMYLQTSKNCTLINYRNCMVCSLIFDREHRVTAIRFMGTSLSTRKKSEQFDITLVDSLWAYRKEIEKQVEFIDWWYANSKTKAVSAA